MTADPSLFHLAYAYRSFEHQKRITFDAILGLARAQQRPLDVFDLSCGPAVLDGMLASELPGQIRSLHLADIDPGFLRVAQAHLGPLAVPLHTYRIDLTTPQTLPDLDRAIDLLVSTNALFHASSETLQPVYAWAYRALRPGGMLVNHQTFGSRWRTTPASVAQVFNGGAVANAMDRELARRSALDQKRDAASATPVTAPVYTGLHLTMDAHLDLLARLGFAADEVWRLGTSAMLVACRPD